MANRVLQLSSGKKQATASSEVYRDISMAGRKILVASDSAEPDALFSVSSNSEQTQSKKYAYTISKLVNVKAVQNSLYQIFTWLPGERVINPEFGSQLRKYLYEGITEQNIEIIVAEIRHCVSAWEPRVEIDKVVNVQSVDDTENNTVRLDVYYRIKGFDSEQYVYSYDYSKNQS